MCSSEWHSPAASYRMSTSPAFGSSRSSSVSSHGSPPLRSTAARVFIVAAPCVRAWVWLANSFHITRFSSSKVSYIVCPEPEGALMTSTASAGPAAVVDPSSLLTDGAQLIGGQWVPAASGERGVRARLHPDQDRRHQRVRLPWMYRFPER